MSLWNLKSLASSGKQDCYIFMVKPLWINIDPGYFGGLGILFISPRATMWAKCSVLFVSGSSAYPGAFLLPENRHLTTVLYPWSQHQTDVQTQHKQHLNWCLPFIPSPPRPCFHLPSGHAVKEVKHQKWLSWGTTPKAPLHLWESALVQQQTKPLLHLRQTHWLP